MLCVRVYVCVCVCARAHADFFIIFFFNCLFWGLSFVLCFVKGYVFQVGEKAEYIIAIIKLFTRGEDLRCPGGYINLLITAICYHVTVRLYEK